LTPSASGGLGMRLRLPRGAAGRRPSARTGDSSMTSSHRSSLSGLDAGSAPWAVSLAAWESRGRRPSAVTNPRNIRSGRSSLGLGDFALRRGSSQSQGVGAAGDASMDASRRSSLADAAIASGDQRRRTPEGLRLAGRAPSLEVASEEEGGMPGMAAGAWTAAGQQGWGAYGLALDLEVVSRGPGVRPAASPILTPGSTPQAEESESPPIYRVPALGGATAGLHASPAPTSARS